MPALIINNTNNKYLPMIITPIHPNWGKYIKLDSVQEFFDQPKTFWRYMLSEHKLLVFKKAFMYDRYYALFGRYFGTPWDQGLYSYVNEETLTGWVDGRPYALGVSLNTHDPNQSLQTRELLWHADLPNVITDPHPGYQTYPIRSLYMTSNGGPEHNPTTNWIDLGTAINYLTPELFDLAQRMQVIQHDPYGGRTFKNIQNQTYPFIKIHPITGKKSLRYNVYDGANADYTAGYIKSVMLDNVVLPDNELLRKFITYLEQIPELVYKHEWNVYDIVIYDNHTLAHSRGEVTGPAMTRQQLRMNINWQ